MRFKFTGVGEAEWMFKTTFCTTEDEMRAPFVDLVFEGLDTFAKVELVGISIHLVVVNNLYAI